MLSDEKVRSGVGVFTRGPDGLVVGRTGPKAFWKVFLEVGEATDNVSIRRAVVLFPTDVGS